MKNNCQVTHYNIWFQSNSNNILLLFPYNLIRWVLWYISSKHSNHEVCRFTDWLNFLGGLLTHVEQLRDIASGSRNSGDCTVESSMSCNPPQSLPSNCSTWESVTTVSVSAVTWSRSWSQYLVDTVFCPLSFRCKASGNPASCGRACVRTHQQGDFPVAHWGIVQYCNKNRNSLSSTFMVVFASFFIPALNVWT